VKLRHGDTGRGHYADGWRVMTVTRELHGTRDLLHPHADEQPFTRSRRFDALALGVPPLVETATNATGWSGARAPLGPGRLTGPSPMAARGLAPP
jgi:hypothetical protein